MKRTRNGSLRGILAGAALVAITGTACSSVKQPDTQNGGACQLTAGSTIDSTVSSDADVRAFLQASVDFTTAADQIKAQVLVSCGNVAKDLGAPDTWSALQGNDQISNKSGTGACDVAGQHIESLLSGAASLKVALVLQRGECHLDFNEQVKCDQDCSVTKVCQAGTVDTRCEPGALSVVCSAQCTANSYCEGKSDRPANCMGKCEATCVGKCAGSCEDKDGKVTENDSNCNGKCSSSCNGQCKGMCKVEAPTDCGASVRCTGSCTSTYTDPVCTTKCNPPTCDEDVSCSESCTAKVISHAVCDPTTVDIFVDLTAAPQLKPLVATLKANLPALVDAARAKGVLLIDAATRLGNNGTALSNKAKTLDAKSVACVALATGQLGKAIGSLHVVADASISVNAKVSAHTI